MMASISTRRCYTAAMFGTRNNRFRALAIAAMLSVLLRSFFPSGFMPGDWSEGQFIMICHDGLPASALVHFAGEDTHQHHPVDGHDQEPACFCDQDMTLDKVAVDFLPVISSGISLPAEAILFNHQIQLARQLPGNQRARAPPNNLIS